MLISVIVGWILAKLSEVWNEWALRALILISLCSQAALTGLGNRRKHKTQIWFTAILWVSYQAADWASGYSLGVLSRKQDCNTNSKDSKYFIMGFWAPFFLLHLCSPDTITAYALEDNELWLRHLLSLVGQFWVAIHVIYISWQARLLNFQAILILLVAMVKFVERIYAQWSASSNQFRESILPRPDPGPSYAKFMDTYVSKKAEGYKIETQQLIETTTEVVDFRPPPSNNVIPDADALFIAHRFFETFKRLFADLILSFQDRRNSQSFFQNTEWEEAFKVVKIELGFVYDVLYTKAVLIYSKWGFLRLFSLSTVITEFVIFFFTYWHERSKIDVVITILLLAGAVVLELYELILLLSSDWTMIWLISKYKNQPSKVVSFFLCCHLLPSNKRWSDSMSQFNLISFCLKGKPATCGGIQKFLHIYETLEKYRYKNIEAVSKELKEEIFNLLKAKSKSALDINASRKLLAYRGDEVLKEKDCFVQIGWSVEEEFDQSILLWHIATNLCYFQDLNSNPNSVENLNCEKSKLLSEYMLYLLVFCPFMLPNGIGEIRFQDTCAEAIEFFQEMKSITDGNKACTKLLQVSTEILPSEVKGDKSKSVLFDACRLAKALQILATEREWSSEQKWEMMSHVWVEMLSYAAGQCVWQAHAKQLPNGGELLTHVWLMMAHLGISEQFKISEGHGRLKLLVS